MFHRRSTLLICSVLAGIPAAIPQASAQTAAPQNQAAELTEIVVTAQKRAERLLDVPVAISAVTAAEIASRGVSSLNDMQAAIPGLRMVDIGPGSQRIQIRGISQYQGLPTVGNYVDEFSVNNYGASGQPEVRLLDLERVEVLRGPQPALYGDGSMGGTIRYVTAAPRFDGLSGSALLEGSRPKDGDTGYRVEGVLNAPVSDRLAFRLAAAQERAGGWTDGAPGKNLNDTDITTIRGKVLFKASDSLSISAMALLHQSHQDYKSYSDEQGNTGQIVPSTARQRYGIGTLEIRDDLGAVTFLSSTGYMNLRGRSVDDSARFYNQLFGAPLLRTALTDSQGELRKWSQEFRVTSNGTGPLRYLAGVSYTDGKSDGTDPGTGESLVPGLPPEALGVVFLQVSSERSKVIAAYGNLDYDVSDRWTVSAGGRYFSDKRTTDSTFTLFGLPVPPSVVDESKTFNTFNPRVAVTFKTSDSGTLYVSAAKGFRSGGFNGINDPQVPHAFDPERLWTYEIGAKQSLLDNRLYVELAVYHSRYSNIQANQVVNPTVATVVNGGAASGTGVDFTLQARPTADLTLTASVGHNHLRLRSDSTDKVKGDPLDLVPDLNWSIAADYTPALSADVRLITHVDAGYSDKAQITLRSLAALGLQSIVPTQSRTLVNARFGASYSKIDAYVFATNLGDERKIVNPAFGAFFEPIYTRPRTFGLGVQAHF